MVGRVEIPSGLGGVNGIMRLTIVQGPTPLLICVKLLRALESAIFYHSDS